MVAVVAVKVTIEKKTRINVKCFVEGG